MNKNSSKPVGWLLSLIKDHTLILLVISTLVINAPIYYYRIVSPVDGDFSSHLLYTRYLIQGKINQIPAHILAHPGLQALIAGFYFLSFHKIPLVVMLTGILTLSQVVLVVIIYKWIGSGEKRHWDTVRAAIAGTLTLIAPVMVLAFQDKLYYFGYIALANYHNPTIILLRPFALASFIVGVNAFRVTNNKWKLILASGILVVVSALIKPNYLLCILPALFVVIVWWRINHKNVDYSYMLFGFYIPAIIILGIQWWLAYSSPDREASHIIFSLFGVESSFSGSLLPKFILSVLFPVSIFIFDIKKFKDNPELLLALTGFVVSALELYLLAESGNRFYDGNFRWGAQMMLFIWFVVSAKEYIKKIYDGKKINKQKIILSTIYLANVIAGVVYYVHCFLSTSYA